jgi:tartrate-resistant acid phosphatase type 5
MSQHFNLDEPHYEKMRVVKNWIWLAACLIIILSPGCRLVGEESPKTSPPSQALKATQTSAIIRPSATPTHTITPIQPSPTFTDIPVTPSPTYTSTPQPTATPVIFAAIGDYGSGDQNEADVANLVLSWKPDFIITLGDNNYPVGAADHIDQAIGQFFHSYIYPYNGSFEPGAEINRFFPSLGNHDLMTDDGQPYYDYFSLPGNERYYDFTWGALHLFALNNLTGEADGVGVSSVQADWLKNGLETSTSPWNIVYMHAPPYSSGLHGSTDWARWPYKEWGADVVLSGHDHTYERLEEGGLTYFVNGVGGGAIYNFTNILDGSQVRYNADYGAMRIEATDSYMQFEFITRNGEVVDLFELKR